MMAVDVDRTIGSRRERSPGEAPASRPLVKSSARVMDILEHFETVDTPVRTAEVSAALGLPNSSVDEILRTLAFKGYLVFDSGSRRYSPSYKLVSHGRRIEATFFKGPWLADMLADLRQTTGHTVTLVAQNDCFTNCVASLPGSWKMPKGDAYYTTDMVSHDGNGWQPGTNFAAALLATKTNTQVMELAERARQLGRIPSSATTMKQLIDIVDNVRRRGFALCRRQDEIEVESIAVSMRIEKLKMPLAIGILGVNLLSDDKSRLALATTVRETVWRHIDRQYS